MTASKSIELTAVEPGGTHRTAFPLTMGLPFAKGALQPDEPMAIVQGNGPPRPVQARAFERHDDGSVRWLLIDYQADFEPFAPSACTLAIGRQGPEPVTGQRIETGEDADQLVIHNGTLELKVDRIRCRPLEQVSYGDTLLSEGGLDILITDEDGGIFRVRNDPEATFEIEEQGPMRLLMRWEGTHRDEKGRGLFDFLVRLTVYAGKPFLRIDHPFFNRLDPDVTPVKQIVARMPHQLGNNLTYTVADQYRRPTTFETNEPPRLEQDQGFRIIGRDGRILKESPRNSMGWVSASDGRHGIMLAGKNFWQNYPKAIAADPDGIACDLIPDRGDPFSVARGMAKTHTFFLCFHDGVTDSADLVDMAYSVQRWPMPAAAPEHYQQSGQVWDFFPYYPQKYPRLESALRRFYEPDNLQWIHKPGDIVAGRAYGLKHFGDFLQSQKDNGAIDPDAAKTQYHNNEYDPPHVLAMMFLRTRDIVKWWAAENHGLHMMNIDTCHHALENPEDFYASRFWMQGCQFPHSPQHIGQNMMAAGSHTFGEGLLDLYHLTGDRCYFDVVQGYAHQLARTINYHVVSGAGRSSGWGMAVMGGVYMVDPDEKIHLECNRIIDCIISQQNADGGLMDANMHIRAFEDRKLFLTMRGIIKWHQATGCKKTKKLILEMMEAYLNTGLLDEGLPLYSTWPEDNKPTTCGQGFANLEALAYTYDLTGDRRFIDAGIPALCDCVRWLNEPEKIKGFIHFERVLRGPLRFMAIAHDLGILERVPGAAAWLM